MLDADVDERRTAEIHVSRDVDDRIGWRGPLELHGSGDAPDRSEWNDPVGGAVREHGRTGAAAHRVALDVGVSALSVGARTGDDERQSSALMCRFPKSLPSTAGAARCYTINSSRW